MEPEIVSVGEILGRVAQATGHSTDTALAKALGVTRQTIGNWRSRGSLDHDLLIRALPDVDLNWLFRGTRSAPTLDTDAALALLHSKGYKVTTEKAPRAEGPPSGSEG